MAFKRKGSGGSARRARPQCRCLLAVLACLAGGPACAEQIVNCGGVAMAGGAEILCNHVVRTATPQFCTFSWALMTTGGTLSTAQGSFLIAPGMADDMVYQGFGFNSALSNPIVLCQGRKS